jgi:ketosteroid isomerase-like protein
MSQENVEMVRRTMEAYVGNREAFYDFMADDIEIRPDVSRWPEAKPFRGREEFRRFNAEIDQDWEGGGRAEIKEVFPVDERVVVRTDWGGTGRASGIDLRSNLTAIFTVRDGQIIKIEYFFEHSKALEAAGLRGGRVVPTRRRTTWGAR